MKHYTLNPVGIEQVTNLVHDHGTTAVITSFDGHGCYSWYSDAEDAANRGDFNMEIAARYSRTGNTNTLTLDPEWFDAQEIEA